MMTRYYGFPNTPWQIPIPQKQWRYLPIVSTDSSRSSQTRQSSCGIAASATRARIGSFSNAQSAKSSDAKDASERPKGWGGDT